MTLRHLRFFLAVCDNGNNVTQAAQSLFIAQPAVSQALADLERYYGVKLFDRIGRRLYMTPAGERFREYAQHIAALFDDMEKGLRNWDALGVLRIGASITIGAQFMPRYVESFCALYPGMDVRVTIGPSELLEEKLMGGALDLALMEGPVHEARLVDEAYMTDALAVVCAARGPFHQGETLRVEQFKKQRFLLRERGSGTREEFDSAAAAAGFSVTPVWEATSTTALVNAAIHGLGITVVPLRMIQSVLEKGTAITVQVEGMDFSRQFRMVHHKDKFLSASVRNFMELCRRYEQDYPAPDYSGLF